MKFYKDTVRFLCHSCNDSTAFCTYRLPQRPFKCWNYTQAYRYADFHGRDAKYGDSRKSEITADVVDQNHIVTLSV